MNGVLAIERRVYGSKAQGWVYPSDLWLGIALSRISVGIRQWCCLEALDSSMATVARSVESLSGIRLSEERVRTIVESEGTQCGTLANRVKGPGMRWSPENAAAMLALAALDHSNLWKTYWSQQRAA